MYLSSNDVPEPIDPKQHLQLHSMGSVQIYTELIGEEGTRLLRDKRV